MWPAMVVNLRGPELNIAARRIDCSGVNNLMDREWFSNYIDAAGD